MYARNFETRIAVVRKNMSTQEEKLEKLRQDRYDNKPPAGMDRTIFLVLKSLKFEDGAAKHRSAGAGKAAKAGQRQELGEMGIELKLTKGGTRRGASRGGTISKRAQAVFDLSGASIADMEAGGQASTQAA